MLIGRAVMYYAGVSRAVSACNICWNCTLHEAYTDPVSAMCFNGKLFSDNMMSTASSVTTWPCHSLAKIR